MHYLAVLIVAAILSLPVAAQINPLENKTGATVAAYRIQNVIPSDQFEFAVVNRAIWVGTGGNLAVVTLGGDRVTIVSVPGGSLLPLTVKQILSTGTTASNIQIWW